MITETRKKTINGREVEYLDVIYHTTTTKFKFWDRIKILFGKEVITRSEIYTQNECCFIVGSEAEAHVAPIGWHDALLWLIRKLKLWKIKIWKNKYTPRL